MSLDYMLEKEVASLLNISVSKLRSDRQHGIGLPFVRINKSIRYSREQIAAYLVQNTVNPGK
jgi:hypothetical protein